MIATGAKVISEVSSSDVWNALASNKTVTHGLAGGGLGMVANAGYNYAEDDRGGYMGSAMAGAGAAIAGSVAWRSGGKKLAHTASDRVKQSVATRGGTEDFAIRTYAGNQTLKTTKDGSFDLAAQKRLVDDLEAKLKNMDAGSSSYDSVLKQRDEARNGLDHMQSVIDHRLSQTEDGAQKLKSKYDSHLTSLKNSQDYKDTKFHESASSWSKTLREDLDNSRDAMHQARSAYNLFKKGGGDLNSPEGQELAKNLSNTKNAFNSAGKALSRFENRNSQKFNSISNRLGDSGLTRIKTKEDLLTSKVKAADRVIDSFNTGEKGVLQSVTNSINMGV